MDQEVSTRIDFKPSTGSQNLKLNSCKMSNFFKKNLESLFQYINIGNTYSEYFDFVERIFNFFGNVVQTGWHDS